MTNNAKPEVTPTPHVPEIDPIPPQQIPPTPSAPEIHPNKQDPPPRKNPEEVPKKSLSDGHAVAADTIVRVGAITL